MRLLSERGDQWIGAIDGSALSKRFGTYENCKEIIMDHLGELAEAVVNGCRGDAGRLTGALLAAGAEPTAVIDNGLVPGMTAIGDRFKNGDAYVPELLLAARAMKECMTLLEPLLVSTGVKPEHTAVIGTVQGDLHDIGKNLVAVMWRASGIEVIDLGIDVSPQGFVAAVQEHEPNLVGLSALLTTTMPAMESTVAALRQGDLVSVKVLVGGAPVTAHHAEEIGADGYAPDAVAAADAAKRVLLS